MAIYINPEVYEHIDSLAASGTKYNEAVADIFKELESLSNTAWIGKDNNSFLTTITPYQAKLQQLGQVINDIASNLRSGVDATYETQANISSAANNL